MTTLAKAAAADLKGYIERVERLANERRDLGDDIRLVLAEAKANGFDPKAIRAIVKRRDKDPTEVASEETILESYLHAIGMIPENPIAAAISALARDALSRDQVMDAFKKMVPVNGEIIAKVGGEPLRIWRDEAGTAYAETYLEPKAAPAEKTGRALKGTATVLSIVPADPVKAAVDAAEKRARKKRSEDEPAPQDSETDEPVE